MLAAVAQPDEPPSASSHQQQPPPPQQHLFTWGRNTHGQCGHGRKQRQEVAAPTAVAAFAGRPLVSISCGHFHSAAVVASSPAEVHTWGRGALGLLGHGDEEDALHPRPVRALSGVAIRSVSCGAYQTAAVSERGELWCWGWRLEEAASGNTVEGYSTLPERVYALDGLEVRRATCGYYSTLAVTADGALYTWGKGERGQLGHGHTRDVVAPQRVIGGGVGERSFVWDARFGKHWLLILTSAGELHSCGAGDCGVLGRGDGLRLPPAAASALGGSGMPDEPTPRMIVALQGRPICAIACGDVHAAAVAADSGEVFTWGSAAYGKLGHESADDLPVPAAVPGLQGKRFVDVACGAYSTLALTDGGTAFSWGAHAVHAAPPARVRLSGNACGIAAGGGHCCAALGEYPIAHPSDVALAHVIGFQLPMTRAAIPTAVADGLAAAGPLSAVVEARVPADADPHAVVRELHELRGLLAREEERRDALNEDLMTLQLQLQQALVDEEMLRERRDGVGPPSAPPSLGKGLALIDKTTYERMLPDEQVELNLFGLKVAMAVTSKS